MNTIFIFLFTISLLVLITRKAYKLTTMIAFYVIAIVGVYCLQLIIPVGFASDQSEYFHFVKDKGSELWGASLKNLGLFFVTFIPIRYLDFDILASKILLFSLVLSSQFYFLFRIRSLLWFLPILFIVPSIV